MPNQLSRRAFLKIAAVTGAAATGCSKPSARELIPYVIPDETIIPGVPSFYSTACAECPAGCGVVARVREGRVIKLEGNPRDPISAGALCARGQAALQGLYNPDRLAGPHRRADGGARAPISWDDALQAFAERLRAARPGRVAIIARPMGPTLDRIIDGWLAAWGTTHRLRYEPLADEAARTASELCFGRKDLPVFQLDAGDVVLSFGADFLETWRSPVELTRQYAAFRALRTNGNGPSMGRAVYIGPRFGLTAANCDEWVPVRPGDEAWVALGILHVAVRSGAHRPGVDYDRLQQFTAAYAPADVAQRSAVSAAQIDRVAHQFVEADGAVALAGTDDPATHVATLLLNAVSGNIGRTIQFLGGTHPEPSAGAGETAAFMSTLRNGEVDVLVVAGGNPVFTLPSCTDAIRRVPFVVWCGQVPDETAGMAHLFLPCHHALEDWSDAAPRPGIRLLGQPVMQPVFETRPLGDILLASARAADRSAEALPWEDTRTAVEATWRELHDQLGDGSAFEAFWIRVREEGGIFESAAVAPVSVRPEALAAQSAAPSPSTDDLMLAAFPHIFLSDGRGADKPWLQEIPEPVTQIVWDSWAEIHPATAAELGAHDGDLLEVRSTWGTIEVPAHLSDRVPQRTVNVPLGQGHTAYGRYASGRGANPWQVLPPGARSAGVTVRPTGARRALVSPLALPDMLGRPIVECVSLDELQRGTIAQRGPEVPAPWQIRPVHSYPQHQWGMTIDLQSCTGCSSCVAACYAENNLAVVGKAEVARGHIKSWMRIERYVPTTPAAPLLYIMPMLCQQCDNAPCESVCPVYAASHTEEGLNAQVYNRCIGTRYCENNCPYKVRRFNWFQPEWPAPLHLQLNPDVTVRGAGVMEKCTFCIQRIRAAEMDAEADRRPVRDGEIVPACAQACPAEAITFGDMKDPDSAMMRRRAAHAERGYHALGELNTAPAIEYLRRVVTRREET